MRETPQEFVAAVFDNDRLGDHRAEAGHSLAEPFRHAAAMQRQVGAASAAGHQLAPFRRIGFALDLWRESIDEECIRTI